MSKKSKIKIRTARTYDNEKPIFKILVAGEKNVGKTTLIRRYVDGRFIENTQATIGVDFSLKNLSRNKLDFILQIWDFAGEDRFRAILPSYMMGANAVILAFDSTNPNIEKLNEWYDIISEHTKDVFFFLISTKNDLKKLIEIDLINEFREKYAIKNYFETSSKSNHNIDKVFNIAGNLILEKYGLT